MGIFKKATGLLFGQGGAGVPSIPQSPEEKALIEQKRLLSERFTPIFGDFAERVIRGDVPVSPQLEQELMQQEQLVREDISRRLGPQGAARTTAGIQRLGQFQTGAASAREQARRSLIPAAFQAVQTAGGLQQAALSPLQAERGLQQQLAQQRATAEGQRTGAIGQFLGGAGSGALLAGLTGGTSLLAGAGLGALGAGGAIPFLGGSQPAQQTGGFTIPRQQRQFTLGQPQLTLGG
jgi:hypothetical protein